MKRILQENGRRSAGRGGGWRGRGNGWWGRGNGWWGCVAAVVVLAGGLLQACTSNAYLAAREQTSVVDGMPDPQQLDSLTRHRMTVGAAECYDLLFDLLQREGCLIVSADRASGLVVARQVLPAEPEILVPMAGEIRHLSFVVQSTGLTSEVRLTVYVTRQWYSGDASAFMTEELGLSTSPEIYAGWFDRLDRAVPR